MAKSSTEYRNVVLGCGGEKCTFRHPVLNSTALVESDIDLLNQLCDPTFVPTDLQAERIKVMLGGESFICPDHGQTKLGFTFEVQMNLESDTFIIKADGTVTVEESDGSDNGEDGFIIIDLL